MTFKCKTEQSSETDLYDPHGINKYINDREKWPKTDVEKKKCQERKVNEQGMMTHDKIDNEERWDTRRVSNPVER